MRNPAFPPDGDTIAAVSTPYGVGGIGIVRMSGSEAEKVAARLFLPKRSRSSFTSHRLYYGTIRNPLDGTLVDEVLMAVMRAPHTYTREDMAEIHCHGGPVPVRNILGLVLAEGVRLAEPGEFTRRAFLNGRLDLVQAEAVLDIVEAKSETALRFAQRQLDGSLSRDLRDMHAGLRNLLALVEAWLDFPEEDLVPPEWAHLRDEIDRRARAARRLMDTYREGHLFRDGVTVVIGGRPNAGKSTLLNALVGRTRAIVSATPGTTRDFLEEGLLIEGIPVRLVDTAGIQDTRNEIEAQGVALARQQIGAADLLLWVADASIYSAAEERVVAEAAPAERTILVLNKIDLVADRGADSRPVLPSLPGTNGRGEPLHSQTSRCSGRPLSLPPRGRPLAHSGLGVQEFNRTEEAPVPEALPGRPHTASTPPCVRVSALRGEGLDSLREAMVHCLTGGKMDLDSRAMITNLRHRRALEACLEALGRAREHLSVPEPPGDLLAQDLRLAVWALGDILGETTAEDILRKIFETFCIGK